jgi:FtsZ-binding cell division protein ZapB
MFGITYTKYPLNDIAVRRAIAFAIQYNNITSYLYNYVMQASPSLINTYTTEARFENLSLVEKWGWEENITEAVRILDEANIVDRDSDGIRETPNGTKLGPFAILGQAGQSQTMIICEAIAERLNSIGFDVKTDFKDASFFWNNLNGGLFDLACPVPMGGRGYTIPWDHYRDIIDYTESWPANKVHYVNEEAVNLIAQSAAGTTDTELMSYYSAMQEIFMRDVVSVPLYFDASYYQFSEDYWVGWPCEKNGRTMPTLRWPESFEYEILPVFFYIAPKGSVSTVPSWLENLKFTTSELRESISKPVATVGVWFTANLETFIGADGNTYGPLTAGAFGIIPKLDAEELISEGKASYTQPSQQSLEIVALLASVQMLKEDVSSLIEKVSSLTEASENLLQQNQALSDQTSTATLLIVAEGIVVAILAIAVVISVRRKPRRQT